MTPEQLKASILQYAIQGKLVEQRAEEGTAEELYQQIQEEKLKLIAEKKIKKEKAIAEIVEDEIPFEIPESWKWVRIGSIFTLQAGKNMTASDIHDSQSEEYRYLCYGGNGVRGYVKETNRSGYYAIIGRQGALCGCINFAEGDFYATEHAVVVDHYNLSDTKWSGLFLKALNLNQYATATAQPGLAVANINQVLIPLPPLEEQRRIVAKIEELLPFVDRYAEAYEKLEKFNAKFPEDMKKSILQYAIMGKLVEQRPEEGTAEDLYKQIQEEKKKLIKEGRIKKEKPLAAITEDEIPFDIPENWKWVRLHDICSQVSDGTHKTPNYTESGVPFVSVKDISKGYLDFSNTKYISVEEHNQLIMRCKPEKNDILICRIGTLGKAIKIPVDTDFSIFVSLGLIKLINTRLADYIVMTINSGYGYSWIQRVKVGGGTHTFKINLDDLRNYPIPLPPLEEQKRIFEKMEELLPYCDALIK